LHQQKESFGRFFARKFILFSKTAQVLIPKTNIKKHNVHAKASFCNSPFGKECSVTLFTKDKELKSSKATKNHTPITTKGFDQIKSLSDDLDI